MISRRAFNGFLASLPFMSFLPSAKAKPEVKPEAISMETTFELEQTFTYGQIALYENTFPDPDITIRIKWNDSSITNYRTNKRCWTRRSKKTINVNDHITRIENCEKGNRVYYAIDDIRFTYHDNLVDIIIGVADYDWHLIDCEIMDTGEWI